MIKKISLVILLISTFVNSQEISTDIREYKSFKDGTTYFIKSDNEKLNNIINNIFTKYWTVNNFKMISSDQIEKNIGDSSFFCRFF